MSTQAFTIFRTKVKKLQRYVMIPSAVLTMGILGGCGELTRVDMATYHREYAQLYPMGMDYEAAVRKIEAAGYSCNKAYAYGKHIYEGVETPIMRVGCSKASLELMCPQRRYMGFYIRTVDKKVIEVDQPKMEEQSCF